MLYDKLPKNWEECENIITQNGVCKFCGQIRQIHVLKEWPQEDADECAAELCDCYDSKHYANIKSRKEKASEIIEKKFESPAATAKERALLYDVACAMIDDSIEKATVTLTTGIKAEFSVTSNGKTKIKRSQKITQESEA